MVPAEYAAFCEQVFSDWVAGNLHIAAPIQNTFLMEYCPEPYLVFREGQRTLTFLTKNPGGGMDHQTRPNVLAGNPGVIDPKLSYFKNAQRLAHWYVENLPNLAPQAGRRIGQMMHLAGYCKYDGVVQFESFPFHSEMLNLAPLLLRILRSDTLHLQYFALTANALQSQDVIAISGSGPNPKTNLYIRFVAELMDLDLASASQEVIVENNKCPTGWLLYSRRDGYFRGIYAVRGNNNLPAQEGLQRIARILCP
jgi:hypothetical protein